MPASTGLDGRLEQIRSLNDSQLEAAGQIRASQDLALTCAVAAARAAADAAGPGLRVVWHASERALLGVSDTPAWLAASSALEAEHAAERISAEHHAALTSALDLAADLPAWWSEPGSRNLFLEMLENGVSVPQARLVVARLL